MTVDNSGDFPVMPAMAPPTYRRSDSLLAFAPSFAKFQGEVENVDKNKANEAFKQGNKVSKYADLAAVLEVVRPALSANGFGLLQFASYDQGIATVTTLLLHASGEFVESTCSAPVSKDNAQGIGSAITYIRRYAVLAITGTAPEDDDGNAAVGKEVQTPKVRVDSSEEHREAVKVFVADLESVTTQGGLDAVVHEIKKAPKDVQIAVTPAYNKAKERINAQV